MSICFRDFKIDGAVGDPGEKDKITYWSLLYQVNAGAHRGFKEAEIIHAVIQAITPENSTRVYLEGRRNLTLTKVMRTMRSHFGVGDASVVFKQMINATQAIDESPYQFVTKMFSLRDRILELSRQDKATTMLYKSELVQQEMQRGIHAGLRNAELRHDLKFLLRQPEVDDDVLLDELQHAESSRKDHIRRFEETRQKAESVNLSTTTASHEIKCNKTEPIISSNTNADNEQPPVDLHLLVPKIISLLEMIMQQMTARFCALINELMGVKTSYRVLGKGGTGLSFRDWESSPWYSAP